VIFTDHHHQEDFVRIISDLFLVFYKGLSYPSSREVFYGAFVVFGSIEKYWEVSSILIFPPSK
jgi:hypothetical protein